MGMNTGSVLRSSDRFAPCHASVSRDTCAVVGDRKDKDPSTRSMQLTIRKIAKRSMVHGAAAPTPHQLVCGAENRSSAVQ
jgi:hypothetical protein